MNIEITGEESAILIAALTKKILWLRELRETLSRDGSTGMVADIDRELVKVTALKEKLFA